MSRGLTIAVLKSGGTRPEANEVLTVLAIAWRRTSGISYSSFVGMGSRSHDLETVPCKNSLKRRRHSLCLRKVKSKRWPCGWHHWTVSSAHQGQCMSKILTTLSDSLREAEYF